MIWEAVRTPSLLADLPADEVQRVLAVARRRRFARREVICHEGDPADTLHLIVSGRVAVMVTSAYGNQLAFNLLGPDEFFGELGLVAGESIRTATVKALEATETRAVHRREFQALVQENPRVADVLIRILTVRVLRLSNLLREAHFLPVEVRIRRRLLELARIYENGNGESVITLTQEELAGLAGTARATVNRVLRQEEEQGTLRLGRHRVIVVDPAALAKRAGET
jgi:CRP/FNR family transcriptional regulator, cyclic AMP receptor protein